ncbi:MAG: MBL fold metallo-hydrolase [Omnitrophica WOR_2 bacterium RIFCSPHIGHO2_02_FULL_45_21]|nr:MAG: MBL fold metallo-hydrolase [Omnitrophica WOR_2 bacterium RIFCSPHIGHO2_02_FULL_45_21]
MRIDTLTVGQMQVNCYILSSKTTKNAILLDPGDEYSRIKAYLDKHKLKPKFIMHTHGHIDHIQADNEFALPVYVHSLDSELLRNPDKNLSSFLNVPFKVKLDVKTVEDLAEIKLDDLVLQVIHTPGHTPGGICLKNAQGIFTGDTLFAGGIGRTDFPGASYEQLIKSIQDKLLVLPDETVIYPGHGPCSTIGEEKRSNPYARIR